MDKEIIKNSIKILKLAEKLAKEQGFNIILAYSGGKDSDILLDLAKKAEIKYEAVFYNTTVENPITAQYIRSKNDIIWKNPEINFYDICKHKKGLPSIFRRFCCSKLKETKVPNAITLLGIRKSEGVKRAKYWNEFSNKDNKKLPLSDFNKIFEEKCRSKSVYFNPIFNFSDKDVWDYISENNLKINPIYKTQNRCGCWLCPFASCKQKMATVRDNPNVLKPLIKTIQYLIENNAPIAKRIPDLYGIIEWFFLQSTLQNYVESRKNLIIYEKSELQKIIEENNLI